MRRPGHRRLQQQLFRWLAFSILSTVVVVALVARVAAILAGADHPADPRLIPL